MSRTESGCFGIFLVDWLRRGSLWSSPLLAPLHEALPSAMDSAE